MEYRINATNHYLLYKTRDRYMRQQLGRILDFGPKRPYAIASENLTTVYIRRNIFFHSLVL